MTDTLIDDLMCRLDDVDRLDRASRRRPPARLATLVRRTVRALPGPLRRELEQAGAAEPAAPRLAVDHALALARTLEVLDSLVLHRPLADWLARLHDTAGALVAAALGREPDEVPQGLVVAFFDEALPLTLVTTTDDGWFDDCEGGLELARRWVALAEEGWASAGGGAAAAAFLLSCATSTTHVAESYRFAEHALAWWPGEEPSCGVLSRLAEAAGDAGHHARAVAIGERLVPVLEGAGADTCGCVLDGGRALAGALADLGEHDRAVEVAGLTAWAAERIHGPEALPTVAAYSALARIVGRAGRTEDAAGWLEHELHLARSHVDRVPRDYAETGLLLVSVYDDLGRLGDALRVGREMLRFTEARLGPDDGLTRRLRRFVDAHDG